MAVNSSGIKISQLDQASNLNDRNIMPVVQEYMELGEPVKETKKTTLRNIKEFFLNAIPAWAKAEQKPSYTAVEVGAATPSEVAEAADNALNNAKTYTDQTILAGNEWLSPVMNKNQLPTAGLSNKRNYLCKVVADPVQSGVYQAVAGWNTSPIWVLFNTAVDLVAEPEMEQAINGHNTSETAHNDMRVKIFGLETELESVNTNLQQSQQSLEVERQARIKGDTDTLVNAKEYTDEKVGEEAQAREQGDMTTLAGAKAYTNTKLTNYLTEEETNLLLHERIRSLLVDKGTVSDRNGLPEEADNFDSYMIEDEELIVFAYNGSSGIEWLPLGFFVDMSLYETVSGATEKMEALIEAIEEAVHEHNENEDAHAGIRASIAAEAQTREQTINAEAQARHAADQALQGNIDSANSDFKKLEDDFHAWIGRGGYLEAYDFGTSTPSQNDLTNQALSQIASITNPAQVWNGTKIENLFDGHLWALTNTQDTDPPIFEWSDQGPASISPFAQDSGGYIVGADPATDGGGYVQAMPGGKGKIIGWEQITASSSFLAAHPVGSIYLSVDPVNPGIQYGGTWVAWGKGRVPVGVDTADTIFNEAGKEGGAKTHMLSKEEMPSHTHIQNGHKHTQNPHYHTQNIASQTTWASGGAGSSVGQDQIRYAGTSNTGSATQTEELFTATNQNTGGGAAHNNLQPYITCYMWRRTE